MTTMTADKYTFIKYETIYIPYKNGKQIERHGIHIYYNWYSHSNYYVVDGMTFQYLKDAKQYIKDNF